MTKLCEHIQPRYESEIKKGNEITMIGHYEKTKFCHVTLAVYMKKTLEDGCESTLVEKRCYHDYHFPFEKYYFCNKCGCYISGPMEKDQKIIMEANKHAMIDPQIIATPQNVYWMDDERYTTGKLPVWKESFEEC